MTLLSNRTKWTLLAGLVGFLAAGTARAQTNPATCVDDIDCIATPQCGGDICDWSNPSAGMKCKPAGTGPKGMDGWCTVDEDCKCHSLGATCVAAYCTFTRPCDAPDAGGCTTGTGGTSGGGGGGGGCNVSGETPSGWAALLIGLGLLVGSRRRWR
jgi:MYXO-CTERM domain-containing protein